MNPVRPGHPITAFFLAAAVLAQAPFTPREKAANLESFETVWRTVRDHHPDPKLNGLNWQAIHDTTRPRVAAAQSIEEVRDILREMLSRLRASHYTIIPGEVYPRAAEGKAPATEAPIGGAEPALPPDTAIADKAAPAVPVEPRPAPAQGKLVTFGNMPEQRVIFESRALPGGAGYIRFNEFLDPVSVIPQLEAAVKRFAAAPGIVLDLRGNPGGIGVMATGVAGFFVDRGGLKLGEMKMRDTTVKFVVFPRPEPYMGKLAILVDARSASTTEILAQGLQDLGRARIFGTRTAGAALPSDIVRLPNGDRFQFAEAGYTSEKGRVLEGSGVTPDVEVHETEEARAAGQDLVVEAAEAWIRGPGK